MDEDRGVTVSEWEEGIAKVRNSRGRLPRDSKRKCRPKVIADRAASTLAESVEVGRKMP